MPFVFLLMIGAVDFGRMWTVSTRLADAAYAGASYGAQTTQTAKDTEGIREVAIHSLGLISSAGASSSLVGSDPQPLAIAPSVLGPANGGNGNGNAKSGSSDGSGVDGGGDGSSSEGKSVTVDDYEILVARYCRCEDNSPVDCDSGTCTAGGGNRRTYVRVRIGTNFNTIFDYPGIPPVVALEREARLRAR